MRRHLRLVNTFLLLVLVCTICASAEAQAVWPGFRHDRMHTGRTNVAGPIGAAQSWGQDMGGSVGSSAIVANGRIYAAGAGKLYCWEVNGTPAWTCDCGSVGLSTPCLGTDGALYIGSSDGFLYAITSAGALKWKRNLYGPIDASPTQGLDGCIYVGTRSGKFCGVKQDGSVKFTYTAGGAVASSAAIATDGTLYFGCDDGKVYALKSDGSLKWTFTASPVAMFRSSPAIADDGTVYIGSMGGAVYALWPDGRQRWRYLASGVVYTSPAISADGSIYFGARDGCLYCLAKTGALKWKHLVGGWVDSSPAIDSNGIVFFGSNNGQVSAVNPDGTLAWSKDVGSAVTSSPAIGEARTLFVTTASGWLRSFGLDTTPPDVPVVSDSGVYTSEQGTLRASWVCNDFESGVARYEYAIGSIPGGIDLVGWTDNGTSAQVVCGGLALVNGGAYYFSVRATNACGLVSEPGVSDGIRVDFTPPVVPIVIDDGEYSSIPAQLHFAYASGDTESGIARYEYSIGTAADLADTLGWTDAGTLKEQTVTGLALQHAKSYIISVRAYNRAGLASTGYSNGLIIDLTAPEVTVTASASSNEIRANVTASDPESGVQAVEYVLLTSADIPASPQWQSAEPGKDIAIPGPFDWKQSYYVAARARNKAGEWSSPKVSAAVRLDLTPPSVPVVTDDGKYLTDATTLHAKWISQDADSGVKRYSYCVGRSAGASDVVAWTETSGESVALSGLSLDGGQIYYFSVRATNGAGLTSGIGVSDGITVDVTPPSIVAVIDDGDYTSSPDTLHATWSASDAESGIDGYSYCVGTAAGRDDIVPWTTAGISGQVTRTGLSLQLETVYYFTVKARNGAGIVGAQFSSDGIEYRLGASSWPKFRQNLQGTGCALVKGPTAPQLRWRLQTPGYIESSAAVAADGKLYVGCSDGKLYAISSTGTIKWSYQTGSCIDSSPAVGPTGCVYFGSYDGFLYCLYASGGLKWRYATGSMIWSSPAVTADGTVYFGCQDGAIYALNSDGTLKWRYMTGGAVWSSPSVGADGSVYVGSGDGKLYCLNAAGGVRWSYQTGSAVDSSPAVGKDGSVYFGSGDGFVYCLNSSGSKKWRVYLGRVADSSPAVTDEGRIYIGTGVVGSGGALHAFDSTGKELWRLELPGAVRSSPAVSGDGTVYVGCADSRVIAVTPAGGIMWQFKTDQSVLSSPALTMDGSLIVGTDSGGIYSLKNAAGSDTTPPTTPVVTVDRQLITPDTTLRASWSASDPESGIQGYSYAVGTLPGSNDVVGWVDAGQASSANLTGLQLIAGRSYYVSVMARNTAGLASAIGSSPQVSVVAGSHEGSIGAAKQRADGSKVLLDGVVVTGSYEDCVCVEDVSRSSGIRCVVAGSGVAAGSVVNVSGTVSTRYGEKVIISPIMESAGVAAMVKPMMLRCSLDSGIGLDPTGLLLRIAGRVTRVAPDYFVVSDGTFVASPRGSIGVEVRMPVPTGLKVGACIAVTGVACREAVNSRVTTIIRGAADPQLVIYPQP